MESTRWGAFLDYTIYFHLMSQIAYWKQANGNNARIFETCYNCDIVKRM